MSDEQWTKERIDLIKKTICPKEISDDEFALFLEQCKRSGLDPLLKQAFCVPRRKNVGDAQNKRWVTVHEFQPSEAGMLARAEQFPDFRGITSDWVHAEDAIEMDAGAGTVKHVYNPAKRKGPIVGAWARVERREKSPVLVWTDFDAVAQANSMWQKMPGTMIRKCSRYAALRTAYPEAFGGLYGEEEFPSEPRPEKQLPASTGIRVDFSSEFSQAPPEPAGLGRVEAPRSEAARAVVDATSTQPLVPEQLAIAIEEAQTKEDLLRVGARIKAAREAGKVTDVERTHLGKVYGRKQDSLRRAS